MMDSVKSDVSITIRHENYYEICCVLRCGDKSLAYYIYHLITFSYFNQDLVCLNNRAQMLWFMEIGRAHV